MFEKEEWARLVGKLLALTRRNSLTWEQDGGTITTSVGGVEYEIGSVDNDDRQPFYLAVVESVDPWTRRELARLISEPLEEWTASGEAAPGAQLIELRRLALRSAIGAPQLLGRLLGDLDRVEGDELPF